MAGASGTPPETLSFPWFPLHSAWPSEKICTVAFYLSTELGHESPGEPSPATLERVRDDGRMEGSLA